MRYRSFWGRTGRAALALVAAGMAACAGPGATVAGATGEATLRVVLDEWGITLDRAEVAPGPVRLLVSNRGRERHELVILKTDLPAAALPVAAGRVVEEAAGELIGEIEEFPPGGERQGRFVLDPGRYVLFCNVVEREDEGIESHYGEGMRVSLQVR